MAALEVDQRIFDVIIESGAPRGVARQIAFDSQSLAQNVDGRRLGALANGLDVRDARPTTARNDDLVARHGVIHHTQRRGIEHGPHGIIRYHLRGSRRLGVRRTRLNVVVPLDGYAEFISGIFRHQQAWRCNHGWNRGRRHDQSPATECAQPIRLNNLIVN